MNTSRIVAQNTIAISISSIISLALLFILTVKLARYLGPQYYGIFAFASAFVHLFSVSMDVGLNSLVMREIAIRKDKTNFYLSNSLAIELQMSILTILIILAVSAVLGYSQDVLFVILMTSVGYGLNTIGQLCFSTFTAHECRKYEAFTSIAGNVMYTIAGFIGIYFQLALAQIMVLFIITYAVKMALGYLILQLRLGRIRLEVEWKSWLGLMRLAVPFAMGGLFLNLYFNIAMSMLSYMKGDEVVGWYAVAYRLIITLAFIPQALISSIWPVLARYHAESSDKLVFSYEKMIKYMLILATPIAFGTTVIADIIILGLFGDEYSNSIISLRILIWPGALLFITMVSGGTLGAINKPKLTAYSLLLGTIINILLNLVLISRYSYIGASITTLATEIVLYILYNHYISRSGIKIGMLSLLSRPLAASLIMALCISVMKTSINSYSYTYQLCALIFMAIAVYLPALILLGEFADDDKNIFRRIFGWRSSN